MAATSADDAPGKELGMRPTKKALKTLATVAVTALALSAFSVSAAHAGHTWEVNGGLLGAGQSETCKVTSDGTTLGFPFIFEMVDVTSTIAESTGCKISQKSSGATAVAEGKIETLKFSGLSVDSPVGCSATSFFTEPLKFKIITAGIPSVAYTTFSPESGTMFASLTLAGGSCLAKGTYPLKGSICAEMPQAGVLTIERTIKFSAAADTACPEDVLKAGSVVVGLRGGVLFELAGPNVGRSWGFTAT
jgi:hypothetical protein